MFAKRKPLRIILETFGMMFLCTIGLTVACIAILWFAMGSVCGNQIYQEVYSPDHLYKVVVFQRDCGATTGFSTRVSILKASDKLPNNEDGNIMGLDGHPDWTNVHITWNTNRLVTIQYNNKYNAFMRKKEYRHFFTVIKIEYQSVKGD